jgi:APA family basic amino acid/polyamine antiporter
LGGFLSTPTTQPAAGSDWEIHSHQDKELVQGLGLTSATMLVMGSMIGSGIFIVSAEIGREVDSPALLIGAWAVAGFMTIVAALSYGELAAMMPRAGGQYVYLREALGPLWGFLYGWTLFLVIQTGTIAAVGVAFGKFLGVFWPAISSSHWIWHIWKVPPIHVGPMVLGNMDVGVNTQNLVAILLVIFLSVVNIFGVKTGAAIQNVFTVAKVAALLGLALFGLALGRNAQALAANFGANFWHNAGFSAQHAVQVGVGGPIVMVGMLTILAVAQVGSLFSADAWNNVTFTAGEVKKSQPQFAAVAGSRHGRRHCALHRVQLHLSERAAPGWIGGCSHDLGAGHQVRCGRSRWHCGHDADVRRGGRTADGGRDYDFRFWLRQWADSFRRTRLLCDGQGRPVLPQRGPAAS